MLNAAGATRGGEALPLTRVGVTEFLPWPEHFSFVHNHSIAFPTLVQKDGSSFTFLMPLHSAIRLISSSTQDTPNVQGPGRISAAFHEHCCFSVPPSWIQSHNFKNFPRIMEVGKGCAHTQPHSWRPVCRGRQKNRSIKKPPKKPTQYFCHYDPREKQKLGPTDIVPGDKSPFMWASRGLGEITESVERK